ncbi:MAG: hypothetical protein QOJ74_995, partial [Ilumatobacteraceae bacterium]|nr:hypothetical protein [Ilumatobacteraceae bacterium]
VELIEILDDDTDAFSTRTPAETVADQGGPTWIGPVAALVLVGLIGYGVVSSSSSGGAPKVEPVTSTTALTRTTQPSPITTLPPPPLVPYYAADPPQGFRVQYAELFDSQYDAPDFQLWATPNDGATAGSWFSLMRIWGTQTIYGPNAYRLQTQGRTLAIAHDPTGRTTVQISQNRSSSAVITAVGWTDDDLLRLATSFDLESVDVSFTDSTLLAGYQKIATVQPWLTVQGLAREQVYYTTAADPYGGFGITVAPVEPGIARGGLGMDRQTALRFLLDHATPFTVDGHPAVAGTWTENHDTSLATWTAGDHIVTVAGLMQVPQLIAIARTVHEVSLDEWNGMKLQIARNNSATNAEQSTSPSPPVPVSFGTDGSGDPWTIGASVSAYGGAQQIDWSLGRSADTTTPNDSAQINTYVDNTRSYVLADLPRSVAATAELHVSRAGLDAVVVPFNDIDPTLDRTFAAYAFSETGPYTAQVIGPDGTVLASWPSS